MYRTLRVCGVVAVLLFSMLSGCLTENGDTQSENENNTTPNEKNENNSEVSNLNQEILELELEITNLENEISYLRQYYSNVTSNNNYTIDNMFDLIERLNTQIISLQSTNDNLSIFDNETKMIYSTIINSIETELNMINNLFSMDGQSDYFSQNPPTFIIYENYNHTMPYMNHENWNGGLWHRVTFDEQGVPKVQYSFGLHYVPTTAFHWGLVSVSKFLVTGEEKYLNDSLNISTWAVDNQSENGGWLWPFSYGFSGGVLGVMEENWYGAMTQGLGMSFLTRMYHITGNETYLSAAENATELFYQPVENGGVLRYYDGNPWYEEYPTPEAGSFVLNGYIYSLIGLYDLYATTNSTSGMELYYDGLDSLKNMISIFDLGCSSAYDLVHHSILNSAPNTANFLYHGLHISLLSIINSIEDNGYFDTVQNRWSEYSNGECFVSPNGANR